MKQKMKYYDYYKIISAVYSVCQLNLLLSETGRPDVDW